MEIKTEFLPRIVADQDWYGFNVPADGLYCVTITAHCKNWLQNVKKLFNDDDLAVQIDDFQFFELTGKKSEFNSVGSWNGNELKNNNKAVLFVLPLKAGDHTITFITDGDPVLGEIKVVKVAADSPLIIDGNLLPGAQNGKLFFDVLIKNTTCTEVNIIAKADKGSKLELKVDRKLAENFDSKRYKIWYWLGDKLKNSDKKYKTVFALDDKFHSLEFIGVGKPILQNIIFSFVSYSLNRFGKVALYPDLTTSDFVYLRKEANNNSGTELAKLKNGNMVEVLEVEVVGEWIDGKSDIWHKISFQNQMGYVLSSFIEIDGQERENVIAMIRREALNQNVDENIVLALAGGESRYKVYATGGESFNPKIGKGVFQLIPDIITDLNNPSKPFYSPVSTPYNFKENIAGGIHYFKWLYQVRYKDSAESIKKAVAAYNAGPGNIPVKGKLNLEGFDPQTENLVKCVEVNSKKRNWQNIYWPAVLLIAILFILVQMNVGRSSEAVSAGGANIKTNETKNRLFARWVEAEDAVILYRLNGNREIIAKFPASVLKIDQLLATPKDMLSWRSIHTDALVEALDGSVYFLASIDCGQNCKFVLYRANKKTGGLTVIKNGIFGAGVNLLLSPDNKHLATVANVQGGVCNTGVYINVIDTRTFANNRITGYDWPGASGTYGTASGWKNNNEFQFSLTQSKCSGPEWGNRESEYSYNLNDKKLLLLKESFKPESNG